MNWTAELDSRLRDLTSDGWSASQIADEMGISRNTVCGRKFRIGIRSPEKVSRPYSKIEIATIISMRRQRITYTRIAKKLKRSRDALYLKAIKIGCPRVYEPRA